MGILEFLEYGTGPAVEGGEHMAIFTHRDEVQPEVTGFMEGHFR